MSKLAVLILCATATTASADPTLRFGVTFGVDDNIPEAKQYGPLIAVGVTDHGFGAELTYSYLSFMDPSTQVHRVGVALRGDLMRRFVTRSCPMPSRYSCRESRAVYAELGAGQRFGRWRATDYATQDTTSQREVTAALGIELGLPTRGAWQLGLRLSAARRDPELMFSCRGCTVQPMTSEASPVALGLMLEWAWLFGRPR